MRVAFFGSPAYAVPTLERLHGEHDVVLVVTQPDAPAGRGMARRRPAVAASAERLGLHLAQPERLRRNASFAETLRTARLDVAITVAYGKILPVELLDIPEHGFLNAHASLLPDLRGAAPIQWALIRGHDVTGVTIMQTEAGLDTGPIRLVREEPIRPDDTAKSLSTRLANSSADAVSEALRILEADELPSMPQDDARATYAPMLVKADGHVRWSDGVQSIVDRWRGVYVWPGTRFTYRETRIRADALEPCREVVPEGSKPGTVLAIGDGVRVAAADGCIHVSEVTPPGKRTMPAGAWARGAHLEVGERLA